MEHGRLPWYHPDDLDEEQLRFYERIVNSPRNNASRPTPLVDGEGRLHGPFNSMLTNPRVGDAVQQFGTSLRFSEKLPRLLFETIVLMVSVERRAAYEWYAHAPIAVDAGLEEDRLDRIRQQDEAATDGVLSPALADLVRCTLRHEHPSEQTIRAVEADLGKDGVTEVVATVCFYDLIASLMRTWDSPLPDGAEDPFQ